MFPHLRRSLYFAPVWAAASADEGFPVRQTLVDRINENFARGESMWNAVAVEENKFANLTLGEMRALMGLQIEGANATRTGSKFDLGSASIPVSFDGRVKFGSCQKAIRDQAKCGSCWAFAAAETLTTNLCVLGKVNTPVLSPQDLISCDTTDHGCHGGSLLNVWRYIDTNGIRSDACVPYTSGGGAEATCSEACSGDGSAAHYNCPVDHTTLDDDAAIQAATMTMGAVEVGFSVYEDFMNYKSGIYKHKDGQYLGGHAVKVVGWGKEYSTFYWIVQNSWGPTWGENGFFRIVNWHEDRASAFAIAGGFACVSGSTPAAPTPAPSPAKCTDIVSYCSDFAGQCATKTYLIPVCMKTCGCCGDVYTPPYCSKNKADVIV